jgi:hypothetical protein
MGDTSTSPRKTLRDLPMSARLVLSLFLLSVGLGYLSALVQLHFKHATRGEFLPNAQNAIDIFHGGKTMSKIEQLVDADPAAGWSKTGQMRDAFHKKSSGWEKAIASRAEKLKVSPEVATEQLLKEREGERLGMVAWLRNGAKEEEYTKDAFVFPKEWDEKQPLTKSFKTEDGKGLKIQSLIDERCIKCHNGTQPNAPALDDYPKLKKFLEVKDTQMDIDSLAQTTHVHLLGFSMLYGLTGLILAFSSLPALVRGVLAPLPLLAQVADIAFWWLAREPKPYGPMFASFIPISGAVVALGLMSHIILGLFTMYDWKGKFVLVLLFGGAGAGGFLYLKPVVVKQIEKEKGGAPADTNPSNDKKDSEGEKVGAADVGKMEMLLTGDPSQLIDGKTQMRTAFTKDSDGWREAIAALAKDKKLSEAQATKVLEAEREGERLALLKWVQAGGPKQAHDDDSFALPDDWDKSQPITAKYVLDGGKAVKLSTLIKDRCLVCHSSGGAQEDYPLDKYALLKKHIPDRPAK